MANKIYNPLGKFLIFKLFLRDLKKQRKRLTLTFLAIAWGTVSIVMLLAFGEGMERQMNIARKGLGEGIAILWGGQTTIPYQGLGKGRGIRLSDEEVTLLKKRVPQLASISSEYSRWGVYISYGKNSVTEHLTGVEPSFRDMRTHFPVQGGRFLNELDQAFKRRVVFLGDKLKERLFGEEEAVGKTIFLDNVPFTVIGVMKHKLQMGAYGGMDSDKATIPASTFKAIYGHRYVSNLVYHPDNIERMKNVEAQIYRTLGAKFKFDPKDERALSIWDVVEDAKVMHKMFVGIQIFNLIIGGLTLLIAGVGIANIMYMTVKERTKEIGIKMALGAKKRDIMLQFMSESTLISFIGGAGGLLFSFVVTKILKQIPIQNEGLLFLGKPTISWEIGFITALILGIIGIASGYFPAKKAANLNPVECLRYE